jgi:hypothetical protein
MPTYLFVNHQTGKEWTDFMSISARDEFLAANPHVEQLVYGAPRIVSMVGTKPKIDDAFRDKLKEIKKRNPRNTINTY